MPHESADLVCKVHGSSSVHLGYLLTQAGVVVLAGLQLRPQLLAALLHALHLRLQLCYAACRCISQNCDVLYPFVFQLQKTYPNGRLKEKSETIQALHLSVAAHLHAMLHDPSHNMYVPTYLESHGCQVG